MELADFLDDFVDPEFKDRLREVTSNQLAAVLTDAVAKSETRHSDAEVAKLAEERLMHDKGWHAMGAFDPVERSRVLDLLGVDGQLVFATFATARFTGKDEDRLYAGSSAQNKAMANFCAQDKRLLPVAFVPLVDPSRAIGLAVEAIEAGCAAVMVPSTSAGTRAPTHPDLHGFWDVLSEARRAVRVACRRWWETPRSRLSQQRHAGYRPPGRWRERPIEGLPRDPPLAGNVPRSTDLRRPLRPLPESPRRVYRAGAGWVVSWMRHLDYGIRAFRRTEEPLRRLELTPSDYVRRHLKFTPFPGEPVDWMMEQAGAELFMFSTDFPHPEGGKDPLAKFDQSLAGSSAADRAKFYYDNMHELLYGASA